MALAMKCDICGSYFENPPGDPVANFICIRSKYYINHIPEYRNHNSFDACPVCIERIQGFIDRLGNEIQM